MAFIGYEENKKIRSIIDSSNIKHPMIYNQLGMTRFNFSRRYTGKVRWRTDELKQLASVIDCCFYDLIE